MPTPFPFSRPPFFRPRFSWPRLSLPVKGLAVAMLCTVSLAACGDGWLGGGKKDPPLPGTRISVLEHERRLQPAEGASPDAIRLPPPEDTPDWPQAGGYAHHAMQHMALAAAPKERWSSNVGDGADKRNRLMGQPVVADGRVYTVDASARATALDAKSGKRLWTRELAKSGELDGAVLGGGVAFDNGMVFVTTGMARVYALEAKSGKIIWKQQVTGPMRSPPAVEGGRVFVVTIDNKGIALAADDGRLLWTHSSNEQATALLTGASPAVDNGTVVMPYASGEVAALRVDTGVPLWTDSIVASRRTDATARLSDIGASPVIDNNRVYVVGHSGLLASIDIRNGNRVWELELASLSQPWIAGKYLYVLSTDNELVCVEATSGKVQWVRQLAQWIDPEERTGRVVWAGPTLASDRLIVTGSHGVMLTLSPYDGSVTGRLDVSAGITLPPAVANQSLYFFNNEADVVAYR